MVLTIVFCLTIGLVILGMIIPGFTPPIRKRGVSSIAELRKVKIGATEQWLMIRGEDLTKPVILFVHGGPGTSQLTIMRRNTRDLEKGFVVVNWDQRGAGKSYSAISDLTRMHLRQFVSDIHEVSLYLIERFKRPKIILVGHSWGSAISVLAVAERPELYSAYIGIGQVSNMRQSEAISYEWTLQQAIKAKDHSAVAKLNRIGHPPYEGDWQKKFMAQRQLLGKYGGEYWGSRTGAFGPVLYNWFFSTEYTLMDRINFFRGIFGSVRLLFPELLRVDLFEHAPELKVPVWFAEGRHDYEVPSVLSAQYFEALKAPRKKLIWFENSAHLPNTEERDKFNLMLLEDVLPSLPQSEL